MLIEKAVEATDELFAALEHLVPQLGVEKTPPSRDELAALVKSESSSLLIARSPNEGGDIVGVLALAIYRVPTGIRSIVEDVIVDERSRRRGIAKALMARAIELAREAGAGNISLTSSAQRKAANALYRSLGFRRRKSNPYIFPLK